ncbi:hypothetical protein [Dechloromonas sp. A34]|uniref:hypothetical protein n=1 Tax=Dechloromonas sp. A34 TaxID=447588 RepID=UPI0022493876|nr:hypothetical protein [Dechloromonas sp. A34]
MKPRKRLRRFGAARPEPAKLAPATEESKGPRQVIEQAARDISRGLRDTDLHGTPSNVPGPAESGAFAGRRGPPGRRECEQIAEAARQAIRRAVKKRGGW